MALTPPKSLKGTVLVGSSTKTVADSTNIWYGNPCAWNITLTVQPSNTSYPGPRNDFTYDGRDIEVGDWIAGSSGTALQITMITSATSNMVTAVAEDIDLYNTLNDSSGSGNGSIDSGNCYVFDDHKGLAVLTPYSSGFLGDTFSQNIFSRFNYTVDFSTGGQTGGTVSLTTGTLNVSTVNILASGDQIKFTLPTGSNFYLTSLQTNMPLTVQCHSTSQYNDTNPYSFKSIDGFLTDDGSFSSGGQTYFGPKNILLQNAEDQTSMNSYWLIANSGSNAGTPGLIINLLSFSAITSQSILVSASSTSSV